MEELLSDVKNVANNIVPPKIDDLFQEHVKEYENGDDPRQPWATGVAWIAVPIGTFVVGAVLLTLL